MKPSRLSRYAVWALLALAIGGIVWHWSTIDNAFHNLAGGVVCPECGSNQLSPVRPGDPPTATGLVWRRCNECGLTTWQ